MHKTTKQDKPKLNRHIRTHMKQINKRKKKRFKQRKGGKKN